MGERVGPDETEGSMALLKMKGKRTAKVTSVNEKTKVDPSAPKPKALFKHPWSEVEDAYLSSLVHQYGANKWSSISAILGGQCFCL